MKDYYYILGVTRNSTISDIKSSYRKLSKKFHPDVNSGDKFFEERFKEIQEAYEILSNETKRSLYDYRLNNYKPNNDKKTETKNTESDNDLKNKEENLKKEQEKIKKEEERFKKEKENFERKKENFEKQQETKNIKKNNTLLISVIIIFVIFILIGINYKKSDSSSITSINELKKENINDNSKQVEQKVITEPEKASSIDNNQEKTTINWINGNWKGTIEQFDINESWNISLNCDTYKNQFTISYPSLNCGGIWILINQSENKMEFREKINFGNNICNNNGKIVIENSTDFFYFNYYYPDDYTLNAKGRIYKTN